MCLPWQKVMFLLKSSKSAIDPTQFLRFPEQVHVKSGRPHLNMFEQQNLGKFWPVFWMNLVAISLLPWTWHKSKPGLLKTVVMVTWSCHQSIDNEDSFTIFQLLVGNKL